MRSHDPSRNLAVHERRLLIGCPFPQIADSTFATVPHGKRKGVHFLWKCHMISQPCVQEVATARDPSWKNQTTQPRKGHMRARTKSHRLTSRRSDSTRPTTPYTVHLTIRTFPADVQLQLPMLAIERPPDGPTLHEDAPHPPAPLHVETFTCSARIAELRGKNRKLANLASTPASLH